MAKKKVTKKKVASKSTGAKKVAVVGQIVPDAELFSTGGEKLRLKDKRGESLVLYFYPKDSTPGCTLEGRDFTRLHEEFRSAGAEVFGVSRDTLKSHANFRQKEGYSVDLLSDEDETLCKIFGVIKMKNMYGRQVRGIERSTFVIDQNGRLVKEWRGVKVPGHAEEVLAFVKSL